MKKQTILTIIVMILLLPAMLLAAPAKGKNKKQEKQPLDPLAIHNIAVWGGAGYSALIGPSDYAKLVGGGGGIIGVGYEYHHKKFMLTTGPELKIFSSLDKLNFKDPYDVIMLYDETMMTKHYQFGEKFDENKVLMQIMLPVMAGMNFDAWYFLGGVKIGYTAVGNYTQKSTLTTTMTDPMAYDKNWANMPAIGLLTDAPYTSKGKNAYGLDAALTLEAGVNIDYWMDKAWHKQNEKRKYPVHMRAAAFIDYGVRNMHAGDEVIAKADEQSIHTIGLHASEWTKRVNSLLVGVKFTALLQMNKPKKITPKKEMPTMEISTYDLDTRASLSGTQLAIQRTNSKSIKRIKTGANGMATCRVGEGEYSITATRADYLPADPITIQHTAEGSQASIGLKAAPKEQPKPEVEEPAYDLSKIEKEKPIILSNLFFATNETTILPESEAGLQDLYTLLSENPNIRIRITGHTDSVGSDRDNQKLSEGRANSVREDMIKRGIAPDRMEAVGKGKSEPIASNDTEEGRAKNRRVEFVIL